MPAFHIYVTEPEAIDLDIVREALGAADYTLVVGSTDFSEGDAASCDTMLIRSGTTVDNTAKESMPYLKHVVRVGVGLDNVDLDYCEKEGIAVYNAPGANAGAVAEYALTTILMAIRNVHLLERTDLDTWNRFKFSGRGVSGLRVGIVGFGHIGKLLYEKLHALGVRSFMIYDPFVEAAPIDARLAKLEEIMEQSTVISLHLPLLDSTKHIINAEQIARLQPGAVLLNAARGGIVDEDAIVDALADKQFTYIADTVEGEPTINPRMLDHTHILITPHIASLTDEAEEQMITVAVQNLLDGKTAAKFPK